MYYFAQYLSPVYYSSYNFFEFSHDLFTLMVFQNCMHFLLLWNPKNIYILKNIGNQKVLIPFDFYCIFGPYNGNQ